MVSLPHPKRGRVEWSGTTTVSLDESGDGQVGTDLDQDVLRGTDPQSLTQRLIQEITRGSIAAQASNLLMLHAAAVTNRETGANLVLVAPAGTGKTTLERRLGSRWGYVTDETVGIHEDGTIAPYEKPLSNRRSPQSGKKDEVSPDELGLKRPSATPPLSAITLIRRQPGQTTPSVTEMDVVDALIALAPETSSLSDLPAELSRLATVLDDVSPILRITYEEADSIQPLFDDLLREAK